MFVIGFTRNLKNRMSRYNAHVKNLTKTSNAVYFQNLKIVDLNNCDNLVLLHAGKYKMQNGQIKILNFHDVRLAELMFTNLFFFLDFKEFSHLIINKVGGGSIGVGRGEKLMDDDQLAKQYACIYFRVALRGKTEEDFKIKNEVNKSFYENPIISKDNVIKWTEMLPLRRVFKGLKIKLKKSPKRDLKNVRECPKCHKMFASRTSLWNHLKTVWHEGDPEPERFICKHCKKPFTSLLNRDRHEKMFHSGDALSAKQLGAQAGVERTMARKRKRMETLLEK